MAQNTPPGIAGISWEENGVAGHFYYVPVKVPQSLTHVHVARKETGVFVPFSQEYSPKHVEQYNLEGIVTQGSKQFRVIITVRTPFRFFPPARRHQVVPPQYERISRARIDERVKFTRDIDELHDLTIERPSGGATVTSDGTFLDNGNPAPCPLGGRGQNVASQEDIPRASMPEMVEHEGKRGAWFKVKVPESTHTIPGDFVTIDGVEIKHETQRAMCVPETIDLFVEWKKDYGPVNFEPRDSYFTVIGFKIGRVNLVSTDKYEDYDPILVKVRNHNSYRFWPPVFVGQNVAPAFQRMTQTRLVELVCLPSQVLDCNLRIRPFAETRDLEAGVVYDIAFPKLEKMVERGEIEVDGINRTFQTQLVAVTPKYVECWVKNTAVHQGPVMVKTPTQIELNVQLDPIPSNPRAAKNTKILVNWPRDWTFRFYPPPLPGQQVPNIAGKWQDWREKINSRHAMRTYMIDRRGNDIQPVAARDQCLSPAEAGRRRSAVAEPRTSVDYSNYGQDHAGEASLEAFDAESRAYATTLGQTIAPGDRFQMEDNTLFAQEVIAPTEAERIRLESAKKKKANLTSMRFLR